MEKQEVTVGTRVALEMQKCLEAFKEDLSEGKTIPSNFHVFVPILQDASAEVLVPEQTMDFITKHAADIALMLNIWVVSDHGEQFLACELANVQGVQQAWIAHLEAGEAKDGDWIDTDHLDHSIRDYFINRKASSAKVFEKAHREVLSDQLGKDIEPGTFINIPPSKHGAN